MRAVVDIGSQSVKYTLERTRGEASSREHDSRVISLAKGLKQGSPLSADALSRLKNALEEFRAEIPKETQIKIIGTAALRKCSNPDEASKIASDIFEVPITILSGPEEARLSFLGAMSCCSFKNPLCIDVGGASTECGMPKDSAVLHSIPWGAIRIHEELLGEEKCAVDDKVWNEAKDKLISEFHKEHEGAYENFDGILAIGGSLVMSVKAFVKETSDPIKVSLSALTTIIETIRKSTTQERVEKLQLSEERAEASAAAMLSLLAIIESNNPSVDAHVEVTQAGLRYGVLAEW